MIAPGRPQGPPLQRGFFTPLFRDVCAPRAQDDRWLKLRSLGSRNWRRERDSNPRAPFEANGFQDRRFQPLTHPSSMTYKRPFNHCSRYCSGLLLVLHFFKGQPNRFLAGVNIRHPISGACPDTRLILATSQGVCCSRSLCCRESTCHDALSWARTSGFGLAAGCESFESNEAGLKFDWRRDSAWTGVTSPTSSGERGMSRWSTWN